MARIVVAGAGAIGASVAYHLALRGARDVVLADRGEVASGSTGKAMGGFRTQHGSRPNIDLALRSRGIHTIIISGGAVDVGVASTVYAARDLDYNVVVVRDACSNSHENSMAVFMDTVFPRMARVRTTDQTLEMIKKGQNTLGDDPHRQKRLRK